MNESLRFQEGYETIWFTKSSDCIYFQELIELNSVIHRIECATVDLHYETIT